jgi:predicted  nucleic acid-binding Zn-ribbon protein
MDKLTDEEIRKLFRTVEDCLCFDSEELEALTQLRALHFQNKGAMQLMDEKLKNANNKIFALESNIRTLTAKAESLEEELAEYLSK